MDLTAWKEKDKELYQKIANMGRMMRKDQQWIDEEFRRTIRLQEIQRYRRIREDSIDIFLEEETGFTFDLSSCISSKELYAIYCTWCHQEQVIPEGLRALSWRLKHSTKCYPVRETILTRNGRRCRGFLGIRAATDNTDKA